MLVLSDFAKNLRLNALVDAISVGVPASRLNLMSGGQPAAGGSSGIILASIPLPINLIGTLENGVLTFADIEVATVQQNGTTSWARIVDGEGNWVVDMDVGLNGSGASITIDNLTLFQGAFVSVISAVLQE